MRYGFPVYLIFLSLLQIIFALTLSFAEKTFEGDKPQHFKINSELLVISYREMQQLTCASNNDKVLIIYLTML